MIASGIFFSFLKFSIFGLLQGKRAKNSPEWKITITSVVCHVSEYDHDFWCTCVKWCYLETFFFHFFFFFQFSIFWAGGKKEKVCPKWKITVIPCKITWILKNFPPDHHGFCWIFVRWMYLSRNENPENFITCSCAVQKLWSPEIWAFQPGYWTIKIFGILKLLIFSHF